MVDGFQKSPLNVTDVWSKILKGLPLVILLLPLPITKKHKTHRVMNSP